MCKTFRIWKTVEATKIIRLFLYLRFMQLNGYTNVINRFLSSIDLSHYFDDIYTHRH